MSDFWDGELAECRAWASSLKLNSKAKPKWLDIKDEPTSDFYSGSEDTRFHLKVSAPEWSVLFLHRNKTSEIRVRHDGRFVQGKDDWKLMKRVTTIDAVGSLLVALEKEHKIALRREHACVRSNLAGAKKLVLAWGKTL